MNAPLDCTDIKVLLSGIIDDEIDAATRHHAERHLAECDACRVLVDEMESLNQVVAAEAETLTPETLPAQMVGNVMSRTVYADIPARGGLGNLVNWLGWLAAAACVVLALTVLWVNQRPSTPTQITGRTPGPEIEQAPPHETEKLPIARVGYTKQSWIADEDFLPDFSYLDDEPGAELMPSPEAAPPAPEPEPAVIPSPELRLNDVEALDSAALLMEHLALAELHTFADVETIRQVALYEDLLTRLAEARQRVDGTDQSVVFAVETILLRVVHGPVSMDDLQQLRDFARDSALHDQLRALASGTRLEPAV